MNKDTHFLKKNVSLLKVFTLSLRQKKYLSKLNNYYHLTGIATKSRTFFLRPRVS